MLKPAKYFKFNNNIIKLKLRQINIQINEFYKLLQTEK